MKKQLKPRLSTLKLLVVSIIIFIFFSFAIGYFVKILKTSDYFKIGDIVVNEGNHADFFYLKGQNIFRVDLQKESGFILGRYPDYRKVRLVKVLPHRLFIYFIKRKAIGLVKLYRYFYVDDEGVLFNPSVQTNDFDLPLILGLEKKILTPYAGKQYKFKELLWALNIIKETKRNQILKDYKITKINVADTGNASFFIFVPKTNALEIKVGEDDIRMKMDILGNLLVQLESDLDNIRYIDLRFKEPVIKFNEDKS